MSREINIWNCMMNILLNDTLVNEEKIMGVTEFYKNVYSYGIIRYFKGERLYNEKALYEFNKGKIKAKELITFDASLMDMIEISKEEIEAAKTASEQIIALIVRPEIEPSYILEQGGMFEFCGYDLVDYTTGISAIMNMGGYWGDFFDWGILNQYGLFSKYRQAVNVQLDLFEQFPEESHAYCEIVEIWRMLRKD